MKGRALFIRRDCANDPAVLRGVAVFRLTGKIDDRRVTERLDHRPQFFLGDGRLLELPEPAIHVIENISRRWTQSYERNISRRAVVAVDDETGFAHLR